MPVKLFEVRYNGSWLGGQAFVLAESPEQAEEMVRNDPSTLDFFKVTVTEMPIDLNKPAIIVNDNGDY